MKHLPFPAIHTAANARAEAVSSEVAALRAEADALMSAIDALCGDASPPVVRATARGTTRRNIAA